MDSTPAGRPGGTQNGICPDWSYSGRNGPEYWGDLCSAYALCRTGQQQSPIDLVSTSAVPGTLLIDYQPISPIRIQHLGHRIQVQGVPSCGMEIDGERFELQDIHFHTPAEHRIAGFLAPMEAHFVHRSSIGRLAVLGILVVEGAEDEQLGRIFANLPSQPGPEQVVGGEFDPAALLPEDLSSFQYQGSRTTPPCDEDVQWIVMSNYIQASGNLIEAYRSLFDMNARPVQARNGRQIFENRPIALGADEV
jgi:carbonic anhydrase